MATPVRARQDNHPERIGRYEVVALLATGGMAEIFLGRVVGPSGFERPVVIKRILPHLAHQASFVDMFLDEARIVAGIRQENVVQVQELGADGDELFLVMEYLEGETAATVMKRVVGRAEPLPYALAGHIVAEICAGLHAAHELADHEGRKQNLVHRDVTPQNVFVTYSGAVKLLDFGIAKAADRITRTEAGQVKGKFDYMSPEQCLGKALDRRSDVFAVGIMLYELSTGMRLFKRASLPATVRAICEEQARPPWQLRPDYPPALWRVCSRALAKDVEGRYATAAELRKDLLSALRTIDQDDDRGASLAALMNVAFEDRIGEKAEMLRRLRLGGVDIVVPKLETDSAIEIPVAFDEGTIALTSTDPPARRGLRTVAAIAALGVVGGIALAALALGRKHPLVEATSPPPVSASAVASSPPQASTEPPPAASVMLHVDSTPAGARVLVDGADLGATPLATPLPRSDTPLVVEIRQPGFASQSQTIVPDSNQRVTVVLAAAAKVVPSKPSVGRPAPSPPPPIGPPIGSAAETGFTKFN